MEILAFYALAFCYWVWAYRLPWETKHAAKKHLATIIVVIAVLGMLYELVTTGAIRAPFATD